MHTKEKRLSQDRMGMSIDDSDDLGIKLRIWDGTAFHEYCTNHLEPKAIQSEVKRMMNHIERVSKKCPRDKETINVSFTTSAKKDSTKVTLQEKIKKLNSIYTQLKDKELSQARVTLIEEFEERLFVSRSRNLYQQLTNEILVIITYIQTSEGQKYYYESFFSNGLEVLDVKASKLKDIIAKTKRLKNSKQLDPGKYTCILSPQLSGLLAHESFGHGMEADTMLKGLCMAKQHVGKKIAPETVSIVDDPSYASRHGSYAFDDEGEISTKTYLMKNGVVQTPISDVYSSYHLGSKMTANGRCESWDHKIYARMSNTYFESGKQTPESMFKKVKDGLYLRTATGGMEDPKGWGIQIQGILAEKIVNGKLTGELFTNITMTGFLPTILNNIKAMGNDVLIEGCGNCGKQHKEWVRVSEGGPHMLIDEVELG